MAPIREFTSQTLAHEPAGISPAQADTIMRARGRGEDPKTKHRANVKRSVREVRDRLTSTSGTRPAFDVELLKLYATHSRSAALLNFALILVTGGLLIWWTDIGDASIWLSAAFIVRALNYLAIRQLLATPDSEIAIRKWQIRFTVLDLFMGSAWVMAAALARDIIGEPGFMLIPFLAVLVIALQSMTAAALPQAVMGGTLPVSIAIAASYALIPSVEGWTTAALVVAAQIYFLLMASRMREATMATVEARSEKDALIGEIEQAKMKSDDAARRAEEANLAKSRFLAQMSHELRTPLNAILGFSEVMKAEIFGPHANPTYREYANDIHASGQHLLNLINEILDLSRIEAGRYELHEDATSLVSIVDDCHHLLKIRAKNRGLTINELFEADLPKLWADERAIRQITLNLLSNAIKFTPQGGEITLKIGWTASGGQYLAVKDTGTGIAEEEIPVVLSSFGQGKNAIKAAEQGTGLGLPIVRNLIEMHGGTFTLRSKLREGTEVIVTFPPERVMAALAPLSQSVDRQDAEQPAPAVLSTEERTRLQRHIIMRKIA